MSWDGYFAIDDREIINVERVEAYVGTKSWFTKVFGNTALHSVVGDDAYTDPVTDNAPWYDPAYPWSAEFYGVYPLEVIGLDDSTASVSSQESTTDGGTLTAVRRSTKSGVFSVILLAASDAGAEYGRQWLTRALLGPCGGVQGCDGVTLSYLASEPSVGDWVGPGACYGVRSPRPTDAFGVTQQLARSLRQVGVTAPLTVSARKTLSDGSAMWNASFTLTAGNAYEFGFENLFLTQWLDPTETNPWPLGTPPAGASVSGLSSAPEVECDPLVYSPLYDPLFPGVVPPPVSPGIQWGTYTPPATWQRHIAVIPAPEVPGWTDAVIVLSVTPAVGSDARNVRLRLYADPLALGTVPTDECSHVGDLVVTYCPEGSILTVDGIDEIVYVDSPDDVRRRADNLVFGSDGSFFTYPALSCGQQYVAVLDVDSAQTIPSIDLTLVERLG